MSAFARLLEWFQQDDLNMHSVLVQRGDDLLLEAYAYPYGPDTLHDVRSVAKSVTALLIGIAIGEGLLPDGVETPLGACLPARYGHYFKDERRAILLAHLLSMTSGLALADSDTWAMLGSPDWITFCLKAGLAELPGRHFEYATPNYTLLAAVLQHVTGDALAFAQERLFGPLGITNWYMLTEGPHGQDPQGGTPGGMGLFLTPRDLLTLGRMVAAGGRWQGREIVPEVWIKMITARRVEQPDGGAYGYGWWHKDGLNAALGFGGQAILIDPARDAIVVMTGAEQATDKISLANALIFPALDARPAPVAGPMIVNTPEAQPVPPLPDLAAQISDAAWTLESNPFGWETLRLRFAPEAAEACVEVNGGPWLPVGLDGRYRITPEGRFINWLPRTFPAALRGSWQDEKTFLIEFRELGLPEPQDITLRFDGQALSVTVIESLNNDIETFGGHMARRNE
jgi:CubicO group peptidase (beta-lactamase class C family)